MIDQVMDLTAVLVGVEHEIDLDSKPVLLICFAHVAALLHLYQVLVQLVPKEVYLLLCLLGFVCISRHFSLVFNGFNLRLRLHIFILVARFEHSSLLIVILAFLHYV